VDAGGDGLWMPSHSSIPASVVKEKDVPLISLMKPIAQYKFQKLNIWYAATGKAEFCHQFCV
jgi:hypothetical protein